MRIKRVLVAFVTLGFCLFDSRADTLAQWTFENSFGSITGAGTSITNIIAEVGLGVASGNHTSSLTAWTSTKGNISPHCFSANRWNVGAYIQFVTTAIGFENISISYDQTGSGTSPRDFSLAYSTDGATFTTFGPGYQVLLNGGAPNPLWNDDSGSIAYNVSFDLSSVTALNNAATIYFRVVNTSTISIDGATVATSGTDRIDNFTITGTAMVVPEPSSAVICLLGGVGTLLARRQKR